MVKDKDIFQNNGTAAAEVVNKKPSHLIAVAIALTGFLSPIFLPPEYRTFGPLIGILVPLAIMGLKKARQTGEMEGNSTGNQDFSHSPDDPDHPVEPYSYTPADPKDPRRYKPIG